MLTPVKPINTTVTIPSTTIDTVDTTINIPDTLWQRSQRFIDNATFANQNTLITEALEHFLSLLERQETDRQFAAMADDEDYQKLQIEIAESWIDSDWEALILA